MILALHKSVLIFNNTLIRLIVFICVIAGCAGSPSSGSDDGNDDGHGYAWSENSGWIDLDPADGNGVTGIGSDLMGYAWGKILAGSAFHVVIQIHVKRLIMVFQMMGWVICPVMPGEKILAGSVYVILPEHATM